jgi:hypothetical protein
MGGISSIGSSLLGALRSFAPKVLDFFSDSGSAGVLSTISDNVGIGKGIFDMVRGKGDNEIIPNEIMN